MEAAKIRGCRITKTLRHYSRYDRDHRSIDANCWQWYLKKDTELSSKCEHSNCEGHAVKRIWVNIWGSLYEVDACEEHAKLNGYWMKTF